MKEVLATAPSQGVRRKDAHPKAYSRRLIPGHPSAAETARAACRKGRFAKSR
jgi:hypothetical protein